MAMRVYKVVATNIVNRLQPLTWPAKKYTAGIRAKKILHHDVATGNKKWPYMTKSRYPLNKNT